jgi:DNA polymerase-1
MSDRPKLILIDGSAYIFRAYHAIRSELSTSRGLPTRAVYGFTRMLLKSLREAAPTHVAVVWDRDGKAIRRQIDPNYKANRTAMPEDLGVQIPFIRRVTEVLAVPSVEKEGWEADDVIATLAKEGVRDGFDVVIVTGDKDFCQLVGPHVRLYDGMLDRWTGPDEVLAKWGVPVERFLELQTLLGDAIDNVPGVPGVGEKTAAELIGRYGDVPSVIAACEKGEVTKKRVAENIVAAREQLARNRELVRLRDDLDLEIHPGDLGRRRPDPGVAAELFRELEFFQLLRELPAVLGVKDLPETGAAAPAGPPAATKAPAGGAGTSGAAPEKPAVEPFEPPATLVVVDEAGFEQLLARIAAADRVGLRAAPPDELLHGPSRTSLAGVAVAIPGGPSAYLPLGHRGMFVGPQLPAARVLPALARALGEKPWYGIQTKRDLVLLSSAGFDLPGPAGDAELACYLLNPARKTFDVTDLGRERLGCEMVEYGAVAGVGKERKPLADLEPAAAARWLGRAAAAAIEVEARLRREVEEAGLLPLYRDLEIPLVPILARMERIGIRLDVERLRSLGREIDRTLAERLSECHRLAGREFNVGSPRQLAQVLFEELKLPVVKRTKTGPSTDHEVLEKLSEQHPLPAAILEHRQLSKLKGTYVDALPLLVGSDGRLHTTFWQASTETGRLSSNDPNLQNIPIRTELGKRIRSCFVAEPGHLLVSADYSQIELRILAHVTGDPGLVNALRAGADVHTRTAAEVFGVPEAEVVPEQRRVAKMINYAVAYGLSAYGLSTRLDIPGGEAKAIIQRYFEKYAGVKSWIDRLLEEARQTGKVETLSGRRRFLPDLHSRNAALRQAAERAAINMPIQGTAADIVKRAMIRVDERLRQSGLAARLLLQVHDELVFEVPEAEKDRVVELAREAMEGAASLAVPLLVEVGVGANWAEAH